MNGFKSFMRKHNGEKPRVPLVPVGYDETLSSDQIDYLSDFIDTGYVDLLSISFLWDSTPYGYDHWYLRFYGHTPVSDEDMEYLKALLAQSVAGTW